MNQFTHRNGKHLQINGASIYAETLGEASKPALLMLHGGMLDIENFNAITAPLAEKYFLVGMDSRGQGASSLGDKGLSYALLQSDAQAVAAHFGLQRYGVIGFSDGGIVGLRMASAADSRVDKLVAIGAHAHPAPGDKSFDIYRQITAQSWRQKFPEMVDDYEALSPDRDFDALVPAVMKMWLDEGPDGYPGDSCVRIRCPLLLVRGDDDHLVSRASVNALLAQLPKARYLSIPFAGHEAHKDQTTMLTLALERFLAESPRP
ncbi:alpha/beta hydrolase [Polaromonas sp.]|uniref:alpha/beta fold hydrolase n=1 Tax=Polaromonas sp. TaxID=1869339 RepID=UPI003264DFF0